MKKVKKTFEEWGELLKQTGDEEDFQPINIAKLYTAWNNEREKLIGALEKVRWHIAQNELLEADKLIHGVLAEAKGNL